MLTITLASTMCVATVLLGQFLLGELDAELIGFFVMGFAVIAQVAFITWWIRKESGRIKTTSEQDMGEVSE